LSTGERSLLREFMPDIKRKFRKHAPKRLQKLEERPRVAKIEEMMLGAFAAPPCPPGESHPEKTGDH